MLARQEWSKLAAAKVSDFVQRFRSKSAAPAAAAAASRTLSNGSPAPRALWGRHKGMECILAERGLYPATGSLKGACANEKAHADDAKCCCQRMLATQHDFGTERSALQHTVETRITIQGISCLRHLCLFLPKFHCELNWIERMWGASKAYTRSHCMYTLQGLRDTVPLSLTQDLSEVVDMSACSDLPVSPLYLQRRWARISRQYMREYRKGSDACDAIRAVTEQRTMAHARHRDTSDSRCRKQEAQMAALSSGM